MIKFCFNESKEAVYINNLINNGVFINDSEVKNDFTIRWGNILDNEEKGIVFNTKKAINNCLDKENMHLILKRNQIYTPNIIKPSKKTEFPILGRKYIHKNGTDIKVIDSIDECLQSDCDYFVNYLNFKKEYRVHVVDQEIIWIEEFYEEKPSFKEPKIKTKKYGYKTKDINIDSILKRDHFQITDLAKKSIHYLGLDFGVVLVGKELNGKYYVIDIDSTCEDVSIDCLNKYINKFKKMLIKYDELLNNKIDATIGADPECLLKDKTNGNLVMASNFIKNDNELGYDHRSIEAGKNYYPIVEIRPKSSNKPLKVFESIKDLILKLSKEIHFKNIGIYAGSVPLYNYLIGGHIHFGISPNAKLIKALDNYLAIPIMMIEKKETARQRNIKYGVLGNYRDKEHGFEYCSLSSWLINPDITKGVLCLAKVIVNEHLTLNNVFLNSYSDVRSFYLLKKYYFKNNIKVIYNDIKKTNTYKLYKKQIDYLFNLIELDEEWNESQDIKENWGYESSNDEYKIDNTCYIPKLTRDKLNINIGEIIKIKIGETIFELQVYPRDDSSYSKNGYISFSSDINKKTSLREFDKLDLWKDDNNNYYRAGPVIGIMCDLMENELGIFGNQTTLFRKLIKISKQKGVLLYVLSLYDINWDELTVNGYSYNFEIDDWYKDIFPIPNVMYERGLNVCEYNFGDYSYRLMDKIKKYSIKFINHPYGIDMISNKWKTYNLLVSSKDTTMYLPKTYELTPNNFKYVLNTYNIFYIKLKDGYGGAGIYCVKHLNGNKYVILHKNDINDENEQIVVYKNEIYSVVKMLMERDNLYEYNYIIQEGIRFIEYNNKGYELRILMIKNKNGKWLRTAIIGRMRSSNEEFVNYWDGYKTSSKLLSSLGQDEDIIRNKIYELTESVTKVLDENDLNLGEVAIDIGIDYNLKPYIIELNSKPDNLLSYIGAFKKRHLVFSRILDYAKFLAKNGNN